MIVITGSAGFIGSVLAGRLNRERFRDLVLVDDFSRPDRKRNYCSKEYTELVDRTDLFSWLKGNHRFVQFVFHLGARTDTMETDMEVFNRLNLEYSKKVWELCVAHGLPLVYASSAATYGAGEYGYSDDHELVARLKPLNAYGISKNSFDQWVLRQERKPFFWAGLKFFNVYGPNEYHKGPMASVVFHAFRQISQTGKVSLFRSHRPGCGDGEQSRDFIYVMDVADVMCWLMTGRKHPGIYNVGTGRARSFLDLVHAIFRSVGREPDIEFIDTPGQIRDNYQYFTEAVTNKLRGAGYSSPFATVEEGVRDYVGNYLLKEGIY